MKWPFCALILIVGCSGRKLGPPIEPGRNVGATNPVRHPDAGPPSAHLVATVGEKAIGPYLAMGEAGGLIAYFVTEGQQRAVVTMPIDATGIPSGDARVSANVPVDSGTLVVRSIGRSFVLAWTALTDKGEAVFTQGISDKGLPLTPPVEVARTTDDVVWIAIVKTASGAVALWAEETQHTDANVLAVALDANGKPRGVPSHAARGVSGWQALPSSNGAVLAVLRTAAGRPDPALEWVRLDAEGHTMGPPVVALPRTAKDMDVARAEGGYVAAWTDRSKGEPAVTIAILEEDGKLRATKNVTLGRGAGSLAQIVAGTTGALVAWEEAGKKGSRRLHLDGVSPKDGALAIGAAIPIQTGGQPELAATPSGFAFLGWARLCPKNADAAACAMAPFAPSVLALDARGAITNADGLPPADKETAGFVWNLECAANGCSALEATAADGKTKVFLAPVLRAASARTVAQKLPPAPDAPEIATIDTVSSGAAVIDITTTRMGTGWAIASLTSNDGTTATLTVRTDGAPVTLTKGALPIGGVSIASADDGAAVAWVGRDTGDPQVHVTKIDRTGKKVADVQLTTAKGDASDVAIGSDPAGGYVVAWVDGRDGNGEVYATHIGKDLQKSTEQRITNSAGDATDLGMLTLGDRTWLAWADARESPKDGFADIWVSTLDTKDAKSSMAESRVLPTSAHSRSPSLCKVDAGLAIAWIEEAAAGADPRNAQSYGAMLAILDEKGAKKGDPTRIKTADEGFATGVWLDPRSTHGVRGMLVRSSPSALDLDVFDGATTWSLLLLDGPPTLDVPFAFAGNAILFGDDGPGKDDQRLRRATVSWKK